MNFHSKPATYIDHVTIKVENLQRASHFYQDVLGFKILDKTDATIYLTVDGKTSILSLEQPKDVIPKQKLTTGLYHFALLLPQRSDLAHLIFHLKENGIQIASADHLVSEAIYFSDPDGNGIEIYIDRESSEWTWHNGEVEMAVDPLDIPSLLAYGSKEKWEGMPARTVMGHIHLHVSDLMKAETFYTQGLGFEVVNRFGSQALFISTQKYHHHIGLNTWNGIGAASPSKNSVGLKSFTLNVSTEAVLDQIAANLEQIGAEIRWEASLLVTRDSSANEIKINV